MSDYHTLAKKYSIYTAILIVIFFILAIVLTDTSFFLGLALGACFSLINLFITYIQVNRITKSLTSGKKKWSPGTLLRILLALIPVYIAVQFPDIFHLFSVIIGLMITYVIILIEPIFHIRSHK